ncbi:HAMP domain-containing histidine kinase [bacterium]|nr:HAMP domain-containing histidine kinase [bacterium]
MSNSAKLKVNESYNLQKQRETFVASISHDLKNPTIAQIRALELFLKGSFGKLQPHQREILEMVLDSCKYMNAMLGSLLLTYRNEQGTVKLASEKVSISELANECIDEMIYIAKDKEVKIEFINSANIDIVYGDKIQIKRVIMNLLSNGIKYAFKNTKLKIKIYNEKNMTCFEFKNSSPYISPDKQENIFARYVSFAQAHKELGIGLGLYASKKIVEAHNGTIYVHSFKDNKNIFGFKIPNNEFYKDIERSVTF